MGNRGKDEKIVSGAVRGRAVEPGDQVLLRGGGCNTPIFQGTDTWLELYRGHA